MNLTIYHNPRCSKSRQTLELIRENGFEPRIIEYLTAVPKPTTTLALAEMLNLRVADLMRTGEADFKEAGDLPSLDDDKGLAGWLEHHPRVLQRPIVVDDDSRQAIIGRPPENVLQLLRR